MGTHLFGPPPVFNDRPMIKQSTRNSKANHKKFITFSCNKRVGVVFPFEKNKQSATSVVSLKWCQCEIFWTSETSWWTTSCLIEGWYWHQEASEI